MLREFAAVSLMALLGAPTPADITPATGPGTRYFDGPPPIRFVQETAVPVFFIHPDRMLSACGIDNAPPGLRLMACVRRTDTGQAVMIMPHPCLSMGEPYALIACHELGHVAGWEGTHPL